MVVEVALGILLALVVVLAAPIWFPLLTFGLVVAVAVGAFFILAGGL